MGGARALARLAWMGALRPRSTGRAVLLPKKRPGAERVAVAFRATLVHEALAGVPRR